MADVAAMDIVIGADVSKAIQGLEGLSTELADLSKTGVTSIGQLNRAMATLREAGLKTSDVGTLAKYNQALEALAGEATRLKNVGLGEGLKKIKPGASEATAALTDLGRVAQDMPFGFIGIQNNINPLFESFIRLAAESKKTGTSLLSTLGAALSGPAGIGVALSLVTAALTFAQMGFGTWTRGFTAGAKTVDEAKKALEDYNKAIKEIDKSAVESSQKQIISMQNLVAVAQDSAASYQIRIDAVKKLQEQYPAYFGNLDKERILYGDLTPIINATTEALKNHALAQAAVDKAATTSAKLLDVIKDRKKAQETLNIAQAKYDKAISDPKIGQGIVGFTKTLGTAQSRFDVLNEQYKQLTQQQESFFNSAKSYSTLTTDVKGTATALNSVTGIQKTLTESLTELNRKAALTGDSFKPDKITAYKKAIEDALKIPIDTKKIQDLRNAMDALLKGGIAKDSEVIRTIQKQISELDPATEFIRNLNTELKALGGSFEETGIKTKHIVTVVEVMKDLNNALKFITLKEGAEHVDLATERINALEGALKKLVEIKAPLQDMVNVIGQIQILKAPIDLAETQKNISKQLPEIVKIVAAALHEQFKNLKGFDISTIIAEEGFEANKKAEKLIAIGKEAARLVALGFKLPDNFQFLKDEDREKLVKEFDDIAKIIKDTVANTFIKIAENIGNLKNPLAGIFELLGNSLIELGKQVIIGSKLVATISEALNAAFNGLPVAGILVGIGLIITGSLLKKFTPFAEGGIVTGPTRALIGEAGPEVVFPLDRLREFIQPNNAQVVVLETRVRGNDIWLSQSRTNERRGRTY